METTTRLPRSLRKPSSNHMSSVLLSRSSEIDSSTDPQQPELFRDLAESLPQMIFVCDAKGVKSYCNRRYLDYSGLSSAAEINAYWQDLIHADDREKATNAWHQSVRSELPYQCEYRMRRKDGAYRHILARANPLRGQDGVISRWIGSLTDVHEQKQAEQVLLRSEKLAVASQLANSIAHQINNPLAAVINAIYLASQEKGLSDTARTYLSLAESELARLANLTSSLRFHRQSSAPTTVDVGKLMQQVLADFRGRLEAGSVRVGLELQSDANLCCFADDMQQVFAILIGNALDASKAGGRIRIRIRPTRAWNEPSTAGIRVTIADQGHGIAGEKRKSLFDSLHSTKGESGTGLGLWVAQGIVRRHQGTIRFRSKTGPTHHGTVFALFFPLKTL